MPSAYSFLRGWWVTVDVIDDQVYEGWLVDEIGNTIIVRFEPSDIQLGFDLNGVRKIEAYNRASYTILCCAKTSTHSPHEWVHYNIDSGIEERVWCTGDFLTAL